MRNLNNTRLNPLFGVMMLLFLLAVNAAYAEELKDVGSRVSPTETETYAQLFSEQFFGRIYMNLHPAMQSRYRRYANSAIRGNNGSLLKNSTVASCSQACDRNSWCTSFEYYKSARYCQLNYGNGNRFNTKDYDLYVKTRSNPPEGNLVTGYTRYPDSVIGGYNRRSLRKTDVDSCAAECNKYSWCTSFEYQKTQRFCNLHYGNGRRSGNRVYDLYVKGPKSTGGGVTNGGEGNTAPGEVSFRFDGYGNPQRPFPGYVGRFQLGPVRISGSGVVRASDGKLLRGGYITHRDDLIAGRYRRHRTNWQIVRGLDVNSTSGVTVLNLVVRVVSSNYSSICPVGTEGVLTLTDDNRRMNNGQTRDGIRTQMPVPALQMAPDGGAACRTHVHGMNNVSYSWTNPQFGGPGGGNWANVNIRVEATNTSGSGGNVAGRYRHYTNTGISSGFELPFFQNVTVRKCSVECNKHRWCKAFEYLPRRRMCYLNRHNARKSKRGVDAYIKQ